MNVKGDIVILIDKKRTKRFS